jgi:hypothetical protein
VLKKRWPGTAEVGVGGIAVAGAIDAPMAERMTAGTSVGIALPTTGTSNVLISVGDGPNGPHGTDENALWRERAFDF